MKNTNEMTETAIKELKDWKAQDPFRTGAIMYDLEDGEIWADVYLNENEWKEYKSKSIVNLTNYIVSLGREITKEDVEAAIDSAKSERMQAYQFSKLLGKKGISSVAELARIAGLPRKTVDDLCSGRTDLDRASFCTVSAIAEAMGISMMDLDQIISGIKQPTGRYSVETVKVDSDMHICDGLDTVYFDTMDDAQKYFDSRTAQKGYGWVLYELGTVMAQKGTN